MLNSDPAATNSSIHFPSPGVLSIAGLEPWGVVDIKTLTGALESERTFSTVRNLAPPLPRDWFRTKSLCYRVDRILGCLSDTREPHQIWKPALRKFCGDQVDDLDADEVCRWTAHLTRLLGPDRVTATGVKWLKRGFDQYLLSLAAVAGVRR